METNFSIDKWAERQADIYLKGEAGPEMLFCFIVEFELFDGYFGELDGDYQFEIDMETMFCADVGFLRLTNRPERKMIYVVNCSDRFDYASADGERVETPDDMRLLVDLWAVDHHWGPLEWVSRKRGLDSNIPQIQEGLDKFREFLPTISWQEYSKPGRSIKRYS